MVPLLEINSWPVGDRVGMGVAIHIMEKSLFKGRNRRYQSRFNIFGQLQAAVSDAYSVTSTVHKNI